jgi:DNA invertase Pin-like site-specific DNA recombinase
MTSGGNGRWTELPKRDIVKFGRKPQLLPDLVKEIQSLRAEGITVPQIMRHTKLSRASIYRALGRSDQPED